MDKNYLVIQPLRLYGRSYKSGEVIEAAEEDVAELVGTALREATIVDQGETQLGDPDGKPALRALVMAEFDKYAHLPLREAFGRTYYAVSAIVGFDPDDDTQTGSTDDSTGSQPDLPPDDADQGDGTQSGPTDDAAAGQPDLSQDGAGQGDSPPSDAETAPTEEVTKPEAPAKKASAAKSTSTKAKK